MAVTKESAPKKAAPRRRNPTKSVAPTENLEVKPESGSEDPEAEKQAIRSDFGEHLTNVLKQFQEKMKQENEEDEDPAFVIAKKIFDLVEDQPFDVGLQALQEVTVRLKRQVEDKHRTAKRAADYFSKLL